MTALQKLQQKLYDIACIADQALASDIRLTKTASKALNSILEVSDLNNEFKSEFEK